MARNNEVGMKTWLTIIAAALAVAGTMLGGLNYVFATKSEVKALDLVEYRVDQLEVRSNNMNARQIRMDKNIDKLLNRFQILAVPQPKYKLEPEQPDK